MSNVQFSRVMDWDIHPTEFNEFMTHAGVALGGTSALIFVNDNGFCNPNPLTLAGCAAILPGTTNVNFTDKGPADHGSAFLFDFGSLANAASLSFDIFYGAADTESAASAAIAAEGIGLYSLGQSNGGR